MRCSGNAGSRSSTRSRHPSRPRCARTPSPWVHQKPKPRGAIEDFPILPQRTAQQQSGSGRLWPLRRHAGTGPINPFSQKPGRRQPAAGPKLRHAPPVPRCPCAGPFSSGQITLPHMRQVIGKARVICACLAAPAASRPVTSGNCSSPAAYAPPPGRKSAWNSPRTKTGLWAHRIWNPKKREVFLMTPLTAPCLSSPGPYRFPKA